MAGLTFTVQQKPTQIGHSWRSHYSAAADNSYPTGGYSMKPTDLGFASTVDPDFLVMVENDYGFGWRYDYTAQKLVLLSNISIYTATFDPASLAATTSRDDSITFTGVASTDVCLAVIPPPAIAASVVVQACHVSAANTVVARLTNPSAGAVDVASGTWTAYVAAAGGAAREVINGTDLSGITDLRVVASGKYRA